MNIARFAPWLAAAALVATPATAAEISTHVLDLARGVGGHGIPVVLMKKSGEGWSEVARGNTDDNGRVRSFGESRRFPVGTYKLHFDMAAYADGPKPAFFPEIDLVFVVSDPTAHYHVPVVVSPYGYSTYRGN
jgi:5-hydroxyisourate hydrolase